MDQNSKKKQQGSFSDVNGFHVSHIQFDCGGVKMGLCPHGTLSTEGIEKSNPKRYISERPFPKMNLEPDISSKLGLVRQAPRNPLGPSYVWPVGSEFSSESRQNIPNVSAIVTGQFDDIDQ